MCGICGCSNHHVPDMAGIKDSHDHEQHKIIQIEEDLLAKNNQYALANNTFLREKGITAINVMSSPGSGKTTLLGKTISDLNSQCDMAVIVADQKTDLDAEYIRASGSRVLQINTGQGCHLDAHRLGHSIQTLNPSNNSILFIENIGNLVCPALFNLGESYNVVILSVTEGDNKPMKYPDMFNKADLILLTKIDLLPYVDFDTQRCIEYARQINPGIEVLSLSTVNEKGLQHWYEWLTKSADSGRVQDI